MPDEPSARARPRPRYALPILQPHAGSDEIGPRTLAEVTAALDEFGPDARVDLDVWLESPGGCGDAAYRIALLLLDRAEVLRFVVLNSARSAATLMTLSADEIYMADGAELGPLDAQLSIPRGITSARDAAQHAGFLRDQAITLSAEASQRYRQELLVHATDALEAGSRLGAALVTELARALDPAAVLDAENRLAATERYARRLLRSRRLRRLEPLSSAVQQDLKATARRLVRGYPTHEFVIDRREAEQLQLPVRPLSEYEDAAAAREALGDAVRSARRPVELIELAPIPAPPHLGTPAGPGALPRQADPRDPGVAGSAHQLRTRGHSAAAAAGSRRLRRRASVAVSAVDDLEATGAIDLDDSWIWSLPAATYDAGRGRHAGWAADTSTATGRGRRSDREEQREDAENLQALRAQQEDRLEVIALP